jgi:transcriptional regulator of arginine metabolism
MQTFSYYAASNDRWERKMKRSRQEQIRRIISARPVGTQIELADELNRRGIAATQSSISRDIVEMGLIKINGAYTLPGPALGISGPAVRFDTAGDNLIVAKTEIGQAQPVAVRIDSALLPEIVGTLAGDDTILIAVKDAVRQRAALTRLARMFEATPSAKPNVPTRGHSPRIRPRGPRPR